MEYSYYPIEELMEYKSYKELCNKFLSLAKDEKTKEKLESILYKGGYKDYNPFGNMGRNNQCIDIERRVGLAYLLIRNPDSFEQIVANNIIYFHGTNANALPGILKYGINSADYLKNSGIDIKTGEVSKIDGKRDFISFTDVLDVAEGYSSLTSKEENILSFPIVIGTTKENLLKTKITRVNSDYQEVGVIDTFPKELISCIMVPSNKKEIVEKMVDKKILVLAADDIENRFYGIYEDNIYINDEKYQELLFDNVIYEYELRGIKNSVISRRIKNILDRMKEYFKGEDTYENRSIR